MMRVVATLFAAASLVVGLCGEDAFAQASQSKALQLQDLPTSVQKIVQETLKGAVTILVRLEE
jgi:NAD(P)H-hydrate repair Nnr-like enzyme with NAD(P)H-hydrate dehydratase domain